MNFLAFLLISLALALSQANGAFIFFDELKQSAQVPEYDPSMTFEICIPSALPNLVREDGFPKEDNPDLWCHNYVGWIRTTDNQGGWLDISGLNLGVSTQKWTVWDYATACVVALREKDLPRLKNMSDEAAFANFEAMIADGGENSIPKILENVTSMRALAHIQKNNVEWLFLELYFARRAPTLMALSLEKNSEMTHRFIDAKIQSEPSVMNAYIYFANELNRAARQAMEQIQRRQQKAKEEGDEPPAEGESNEQ